MGNLIELGLLVKCYRNVRCVEVSSNAIGQERNVRTIQVLHSQVKQEDPKTQVNEATPSLHGFIVTEYEHRLSIDA